MNKDDPISKGNVLEKEGILVRAEQYKTNLDVITIGAALIDYTATVKRFPGNDDEVFVSDLKISGGGSAANVAIACSRLGLKVGFIGKIGNDANGRKLREDFIAEGVDPNGLVISDSTPTGMCYIALTQGDRRMFAFSGAANELDEDSITQYYVSYTKMIYLANLKNLSGLVEAARLAKKASITVCLNPGALIAEHSYQELEELLKNTDLLIASQHELIKIFSINNLGKALKELFDNTSVKLAAITLGAEGAIVANSEERWEIPPIPVPNVVDTTGAGDAFAAGFLTGLNEGKHPQECGRMGTATASLLIQKVGARHGLPNRSDIENILKES